MKTPDNIRQAVPFLWVSDMDRSLRYYVNDLGFEVSNQWVPDGRIEWCWLQLGGAALMLQEVRKNHLDQWFADGKPGHGVTIYFICDDALTVYRDALARGIALETPFVGNGMWVVGMSDPDGYSLTFESKTDVKEGTEYTD
ncbi:VOC family protein [Dyadobacter sp. 22481]|jgi:catechol 2,3-dioxygenase-like lactoylglutathione lyase family enzyme|uniref:VOC family protein n=1 Tax=Dyadobacter sp. 22481 TaxID=3453926 RepID=UPI003F87EFA6